MDRNIQTPPTAPKEFVDAESQWIAEEINRGPPKWIEDDQNEQPKEYDWFGTSLEMAKPTDSRVARRGPDHLPLSRTGDCDWFSETSAPQKLPEVARPFNKASKNEWFSQALEVKVGSPAPRRSDTADWFSQAIQSENSLNHPETPAAILSLKTGPGGWFSQALQSMTKPSKGSEVLTGLPVQGSEDWFSQALEMDVVPPPKVASKLAAGHIEWFSQALASQPPTTSTTVGYAVPSGPVEWFTDAMTSVVETKPKCMASCEWFTDGVPECVPPAESKYVRANPEAHEWFMEAIHTI